MAPLALPATTAELLELAKTNPEDFKRAVKEDPGLLWSNKERGPSVMYDLAKEGLLGLTFEQIMQQPYLMLQSEGGENVMEAAIAWGKLEQLVPLIPQCRELLLFYRKGLGSLFKDAFEQDGDFIRDEFIEEVESRERGEFPARDGDIQADRFPEYLRVRSVDAKVKEAIEEVAKPLKGLLTSTEPVIMTEPMKRALNLVIAAAGIDIHEI